MIMDNIKEKGKEFFIGFRNTMGDIAERAEKSNQQLNDYDLCDTNLFAFLNDLLKSLKDGKKEELIMELNKNEKLSKELLIKEMEEHLESLQSLSEKELQDKNIKGLEQLKKQFVNENIKDNVFTLIKNKLIDAGVAFAEKLEILPRDIIESDNRSNDNLTDTIKDVTKKTHKI